MWSIGKTGTCQLQQHGFTMGGIVIYLFQKTLACISEFVWREGVVKYKAMVCGHTKELISAKGF